MHHFGYGIVNKERESDFSFLFSAVAKGLKLLGLDWTPHILIADNSPAIANGFENAFGKPTITNWRVNCWAHAIRNIDDELSHVLNKDNAVKMRVDILQIQAVHAFNLFHKATKLFYIKWSDKDLTTTKFIDYFNTQWCLIKNGWFEGFQDGIPSQTNALESVHRHDIKAFGNIIQRSTTKRFINGDGQRVVEEWSLERCPIFSNGNVNTNLKAYSTKPILLRRDWDAAWSWDSKKYSFCQVYSDKNIFITSDTIAKLTKENCKKFIADIENCDFDDFDVMMARINEMFIVKFNYITWENSTCTCTKALKYYRCSHIICLASRLVNSSTQKNYVDISDDVFKMQKLNANRKAGRPAATVTALRKQPNELADAVGVSFCNDDNEVDLNGSTSGKATTSQAAIDVQKPKRGRPSNKDKAAKLAIIEANNEEAVVLGALEAALGIDINEQIEVVSNPVAKSKKRTALAATQGIRCSKRIQKN